MNNSGWSNRNNKEEPRKELLTIEVLDEMITGQNLNVWLPMKTDLMTDPLAMQTERLKGMIVGQNSQEQQTIENRGLGDLRSDEIEISIEMIGLIVGQMTDLIDLMIEVLETKEILTVEIVIETKEPLPYMMIVGKGISIETRGDPEVEKGQIIGLTEEGTIVEMIELIHLNVTVTTGIGKMKEKRSLLNQH